MTVYTLVLVSYLWSLTFCWDLELGDTGLVADIKKVLLNIIIDERHRDFLRFLWVENISEKQKIVVYRFWKVVVGVTSSPFLLGVTIKSYVTKYIVAQIALVTLKKYG